MNIVDIIVRQMPLCDKLIKGSAAPFMPPEAEPCPSR